MLRVRSAQCEHRLPAQPLPGFQRRSFLRPSAPYSRHRSGRDVTEPALFPPPLPPGNGAHAARAAAPERTPRSSRCGLRAAPARLAAPPSFPPLLVTCSRACAVPSPGTCPHHVTERAGSTASPALSFEAKISRIGKKIKKLKIKKVPQPHTSTAPINPRCRPALQAPQSRFTSVSWILMFFSPFLPSFRPQGHLRSTHCFPPSSYSCLEIHICWNVPWGELGAL